MPNLEAWFIDHAFRSGHQAAGQRAFNHGWVDHVAVYQAFFVTTLFASHL